MECTPPHPFFLAKSTRVWFRMACVNMKNPLWQPLSEISGDASYGTEVVLRKRELCQGSESPSDTGLSPFSYARVAEPVDGVAFRSRSGVWTFAAPEEECDMCDGTVRVRRHNGSA